MSIFSKILKVLDNKDKTFLFILFIILLITTFAELINLSSIVALANFIFNEQKFLEFLSKNSYLNKYFDENNLDNLTRIIVATSIFVLIIKIALLLIFFWIKNKFLFLYEAKLKKRMHINYLNQNYNFFLKNSHSELLRNINTEVGNFRYVALQVPVQMLFDFMLILLIGISLVYIKPIETFLVIFFLTSILIIYYFVVKNKIKKWSLKKFDTENAIIKNLLEGFTSIKEILIYGKSKSFINKNHFDNTRLSNINVVNYFVSEIPRHLLEFFTILIFLIYLYFISTIQERNLEESIFTLTLFSISIYKLLPSFLKIANAYQAFRFGKPSIDTIFKDTILLENKNIILNLNETLIFKNLIEIKDLNLKINNKLLYKKNLNIKINKNEKILIVGPSGSGKTSLLLMLAGLIVPSNGLINSDDVDIQKNIHSWRNNISWVDQRTVLFDESIKNNITIMEEQEKFNENKFKQVMKIANLKHPDYDKIVGENNKLISGGEAQRISLARALYQDKDIILLDEFTSNLDSENINKILSNLNLLNNKTIIAISHDNDIAKFFDRKIEI